MKAMKKKTFDNDFEKKILSGGTINDRVALLCEKVHENPVKSTQHLETLVNMVSPKSKREALLVIDLLKDLFIDDIIPKGDLSKISAAETGKKGKPLPWISEPRLQELYSKFIDNLSILLKDTIAATKNKSLVVLYELLVARSVHRDRLVLLLVNKLGDPERRVASAALHRLRLLARALPQLREQVVEEVERFLHRPNLAPKALYYGLCYLNQLVLSKKLPGMALKLVRIYCAFFRAQSKSVEGVGTSKRLLAALLTGLHRAVPFTNMDMSGQLQEHVDNLFRMVHTLPFSVSVQALLILHQLAEKDDHLGDRFYCALYRKLSCPELATSNKKTLLLHLVYKSMRRDHVDKRVRALIKRLLQSCPLQEVGYICGVLLLVDKLTSERPRLLTDAMRQPGLADSDEEEQVGSEYKPSARNPLYCGAEHALLWELLPLSRHYHPTVRLFTEQLLAGKRIQYSGDPLKDFRIKRFLDRLSYKNPKKMVENISVNQKFRSRDTAAAGARGLPLHSNEYMSLPEEKVPEDELFIYHHLKSMNVKKRKKKKDEEEDSDAGSVSDSEFDRFLDKEESSKKELVDFSTELDSAKRDDVFDDVSDDDEFVPDSDDEEMEAESEEDEELMPSTSKKEKKTVMDEFVDADAYYQMDFGSGSGEEEDNSKSMFDGCDLDEDEDDEPKPKKSKQSWSALEADSEVFGDMLDNTTDGENKKRKQMEWDDRRNLKGRDWRRSGKKKTKRK